MSANPHLAARERIASGISTLPGPLKDTNAAGFLKIVGQLKQSYIAMLELQMTVAQVDVTDRAAVTTLVTHLEDYVDVSTGELNEDRTRCGNIRRTQRVMALDEPEAASVNAMIDRLGSADDEFVYEVENAANDALKTAQAIQRADTVADAANAQQAYVDRTTADKAQIKQNLIEMDQISQDLLDRI